MKKLIAVAAVALCASAFAELKIGTVDMRTLVRNHEDYERNRTLLQETEKGYQKDLDRMRADLDALQDEGKKTAEQAKNPMLAQAARDKIEKELLEIQNKYISGQQKLRAKAMESQQNLQDLESRLLKMTTDSIRKKVNAFAEKNGYDLIVESTVTAFAKESLNVTDGILREMGVDPKDAKRENDKDEGK